MRKPLLILAAGCAEGAVDEAAVLKVVGGDRVLLREIVVLFLEDYPKKLTEISDALGRNDAQAVEFAGHALKGAAMTLCAHRVVERALSVEQMGRAAELQPVSNALARLEQELAHAHAALAEIACKGEGSLEEAGEARC